MAKTPAAAAKAPTAPVPPAPAVEPFAIAWGGEPEEVRAVGRGGGEPSALMKAIGSLPAPQNGQYASFFMPAETVPDTITDAGEREKATVEKVKKALNSASGATRRVSKQGGGVPKFAVRRATVNGVAGIRVYRIADGTASA